MKIQLGSIVMNKTKKYLFPCIRSYGQEFIQRLTYTMKVAIGIGDIITIKSNIKFEKHIFVLIETKTKIKEFNFPEFLSWVREQEMYEEDYAFDHLSKGFLHMIVIKLPENCYNSFETFKKGEYSKMYTPERLKELFDQSTEQYKVLIKDHNYKLTFSKALQKEYQLDDPITVDEIDNSFEFDFPLKEIEEIFNTEYR